MNGNVNQKYLTQPVDREAPRQEVLVQGGETAGPLRFVDRGGTC